MMNRRFASLLCALLLLVLPAAAQALCAYDVILPEGYDAGEESYPVYYVLPQDGYAKDDGLCAMLDAAGEGMILVCPSFEQGMNPAEEIHALFAQIDADYRTIADREHRALIGAGVGGYLAYAIGLESEHFAALCSVRGDFGGVHHPYKDVLGDVYDRMELMQLENPGVFDTYYTYMDAPVDDPYTDMQHSTAELGSMMITWGTGSAFHEFTVRPGMYDGAFLAESAARIADRLGAYMADEQAQEEAAQQQEEAAPLNTQVSVSIDGDMQMIDLSGGWHFNYAGQETMDVSALDEAQFTAWPLAAAGVSSWTKGYGNISDENVVSGYGPDYFDYFITGNGYYAKAFDVPAEFDCARVVLSVGFVDDRCEAYVNGVRVGATGMDERGNPTGETTWAAYSRFEIDPSLLVRGGRNTVVVRAYNDLPFGAGGWYGGPIALCSGEMYDAVIGPAATGEHERFYSAKFTSAYAAKALGETQPIENDYLIYLPEGYFESDRCYPTVYLLHQFNSDHTSYKADKIDQLMDAGVESGAFDEMIVVIPNSSGESWWAGDWEKMIVEELIPHVDSTYRTINDARCRMTMGCSMGGQGAFGVALRHPDFFSGSVSFYGAFSYGGANSPNAIAAAESAEYMDSFSLYFICGNQDSYGFGVPAIALHQQLDAMNVDHGYFIENGGHDSTFYVPYFEKALGWVRNRMYAADENAASQLAGSVSADGAVITAQLTALEGVGAYMHTIPASSYTVNPDPALDVVLIAEIRQDGAVVHTAAQRAQIAPDQLTASMTLDASALIDPAKDAEVVFKAAIFDQIAELGSAAIEAN